MPQTYNLDLATMLSTLARRKLSGSLTADVPKGKARKEPLHMEILVDHGVVISSQFTQGQLQIEGEQALQAIAQLGVIPWVFAVSAMQSNVLRAHSSSSLSTSRSIAWIPQRLGAIPPSELSKLPRPHFMVYAAIDGQKSIEDLASLLHATPEQIKSVLLDLQNWKLINMTSSS